MIKTLRLLNFKAFKDTGVIELKPITVLAGPNSGGKSSILQSLLLLKQTFEREDPAIDLMLHGRFLQLSGLDELTFGKPRLQHCKVGYQFTFETRIRADFVSQSLPNLVVSKGTDVLPVQSDIEFYFSYKEGEDGKRRVLLDSFDMLSKVQNVKGPRLTITFGNRRYEVKLKGKLVDVPEAFKGRKIVSYGGRNFLPRHLFLEPDAEEKVQRSLGVPLDRILRIPLARFEEEFEENLEYLGPLRQEPQRVYLHSGSPFAEIGQRGENSAQILWLERDDPVWYTQGLSQKPRKLKLMDAVNTVFEGLGIQHPIDVSSEKSIIYQILFGLTKAKRRKQVTIADVGFGVSQLLPVVVMGLRSKKSALLMFEQPEIHLHPKLQGNLADFFLTLALSGKRIVVETHSIQFINRLRRRIAEDPHDELKNLVSILFVRPPHEGEGAIIEPLQVDRYGVIENWPPDFLPEAADEAEAIFRAGLEKRKG